MTLERKFRIVLQVLLLIIAINLFTQIESRSLEIHDDGRVDMEDIFQDDSGKTISDDKGNTSSSCTCGNRNEENRIVGGESANVGEFPWRCGLFLKHSSGAMELFCGCSIIAQKYVLTAAHCTDAYPDRDIFVNAGDHDLTTKGESKNQVIKVEKFFQHKGYDRYVHDSDLSVLRLEAPLNFSREIGAICLPWGGQQRDATNDYSHGNVIASGSGTTTEGGSVSPVLMKVELPLLPRSICQTMYGKSRITTNMICTYEEGKDTCQGDSGTTIDIKGKDSQYYAVGITSWGAGCAQKNKPGVYAKVINFLNWIESKAPDAEFCRP